MKGMKVRNLSFMGAFLERKCPQIWAKNIDRKLSWLFFVWGYFRKHGIGKKPLFMVRTRGVYEPAKVLKELTVFVVNLSCGVSEEKTHKVTYLTSVLLFVVEIN